MEKNGDIIVPESKKIFEGLSAKDKPDMVESDHISLFDLHDDMKTVDAIPIEELNMKVKEESSATLINKVPDPSVLLNRDGPRE